MKIKKFNQYILERLTNSESSWKEIFDQKFKDLKTESEINTEYDRYFKKIKFDNNILEILKSVRDKAKKKIKTN